MNPANTTYERKMESQLNEWGEEIEKLKKQAEEAEPEVRKACFDRLETLDRMRRNGFARLQQIREAGDDEWESLRSDMDSLWDDIRKEFKAAYETVK